MIGFLCSNSMKRGYSKLLHSLNQKFERRSGGKVIVFTISDIDLTSRMVKGSLVTADKIKNVNVPLPPVIFNMSIQQDWEGIRKQRALTEMEGLKFINNVNAFDQSMFMDMLLSSRKTSEYVLPFHVYNKKIRDFKPHDEKSYIVMPSKGGGLSRLIYTVPEPGKESIGGSQYFKKGHICDYIDASLYQKRWIFMELPDIVVHNNYPIVLRVYLQRSDGETWSILGWKPYQDVKFPVKKLSGKLDDASLLIIEHVYKYMPSLGHCFIDFVVGADNSLYFLHLGGLSSILKETHSDEFYEDFYRNMLALGRYYVNSRKEA